MPTNLQYDWNLGHVKSSSMVFSVCSYWRLVVLCLRNAGLNTTIGSDNSIQAVRPRALMFLTEHETTTDLIPNIFSIFKRCLLFIWTVVHEGLHRSAQYILKSQQQIRDGSQSTSRSSSHVHPGTTSERHVYFLLCLQMEDGTIHELRLLHVSGVTIFCETGCDLCVTKLTSF